MGKRKNYILSILVAILLTVLPLGYITGEDGLASAKNNDKSNNHAKHEAEYDDEDDEMEDRDDEEEDLEDSEDRDDEEEDTEDSEDRDDEEEDTEDSEDRDDEEEDIEDREDRDDEEEDIEDSEDRDDEEEDTEDSEDQDDLEEDMEDAAEKALKQELKRALENVKGKPSEEVIRSLLEKEYDLDEIISTVEQEDDDTELQRELADELYEKLQESEADLSEQEVTESLSNLAELYEALEEIEEAIDVQKEVIKKQKRDLKAYKELAKLYEKQGKKGMNTFVNGDELQFDVPPVIKSGTTLVPFRGISQSLGAEVSWDPDTKTVTVKKGETTVVLVIGSKIAMVNEEELTLSVPAEAANGRTVIPLRFISEAFGADVQYDAETKSIVINEEEATAAEDSEAIVEETATTEPDASEEEVTIVNEADKSGDTVSEETSETDQQVETTTP